jgi:hypothetical protein
MSIAERAAQSLKKCLLRRQFTDNRSGIQKAAPRPLRQSGRRGIGGARPRTAVPGTGREAIDGEIQR